ncbi:unnamed protein product, partial [marine sediment metagenome]
NSYGFRPNRNAHQAIKKARQYINRGYTWVVDIEKSCLFLEGFINIWSQHTFGYNF